MKKIKRLLILVLIIAAVAVFVNEVIINRAVQDDGNSVRWDGKQIIRIPNSQNNGISVPGTSDLYLIANQAYQNVNFYNPETNNCFFVFKILIDDTVYWESGNCKPGNGYYEIRLSQELNAGEYDGFVVINCYSLNGDPLNTAFLQTKIHVIGGNANND